MKSMGRRKAADGQIYRGLAGKVTEVSQGEGYVVLKGDYTYTNKQGKHMKESTIYFYDEQKQTALMKLNPAPGTNVIVKAIDAVDGNGNPMENTYIGCEFQLYSGSLKFDGEDPTSDDLKKQDSYLVLGEVPFINTEMWDEATQGRVPMKSKNGNIACEVAVSYQYGKDDQGKSTYRTAATKFYNSPNATDKFKASNIFTPYYTNKDGQEIVNHKCLNPVENVDGSKTYKVIAVTAQRFTEFTYKKGEKAGTKGYSFQMGGEYVILGERTSAPKTQGAVAPQVTAQAPAAPQAPTAPQAPVAPTVPQTPVAPAAPQAPVAPTAPVAPQAPVQPVVDEEFVSAEDFDIPFFTQE